MALARVDQSNASASFGWGAGARRTIAASVTSSPEQYSTASKATRSLVVCFHCRPMTRWHAWFFSLLLTFGSAAAETPRKVFLEELSSPAVAAHVDLTRQLRFGRFANVNRQFDIVRALELRHFPYQTVIDRVPSGQHHQPARGDQVP